MAGPVPIQARQQPHAGSSAHPHASLTPSTLSTSLLSSSQHLPYPSTPSSGAGRTLLSPLQRPAPTPIPFSTSGPRTNQGMGSYGTSLAKSLRMGSYGGMGSFEDRMRMGSWKGKYVGNDAGPAWFGGVDSHDFSSMAMSTSVESIGGSMKMARNEAEYCQNYNCCGLELSSMHDLLEHYEDVHVIILPSPQSTPQGGSSHDVDSMELDSEPASSSSSSGSTNSNPNSPPLKRRQPIPASAPLQLSDVLAPPTNAAFETSVFSTSAGRKKTKQALAGRAAFTNPGEGAGTDGQNGQQAQQTPGASTVWEGEYKFGTGTPPPAVLPVVSKNQSIPAPTPASCIPPKLLFPSSSNPPASANDAAAAVLAAHQGAIASAALLAGPNGQATIQTLALAHPNGIPPPSSGQKIFKCPTPGCQKSYKQQNGLKYHLKVGQCNFEVRDAVENGLSEAEAEEKSRPFVCQVGGGCTKRYRQMNGLRYHYLNSGAHGAIGLAMVAQGKHGHPKLPGGAYAPGGQGNGFTSTTAMGQLAAANAAAALAAAAQQTSAAPTSIVNGPAPATAQQLTAQQAADLIARQAAQAQQQHTQPGPWEQAAPKSDEVLFTVVENDDDVDMDME